MAHSPEQMRKKEMAQEEAEKHHKYAKADGSMDRPAEVENQKREDQDHQFGNYLSGQRRIGRDPSSSALKLNAAFQSGKYDSE